MSDPHEKITIHRDDVADAPPEKITIRDTDLASRGTPPQRLLALPARLVDEPSASPPSSATLPLIAWIGLTLVPFINAVVWWQYAPRDERRNLFRTIACLMGFVSLFGGVAVVLYAVWPGPDWIERIASRADRSVVLIESQPDAMGTGFVVASDGDEHLILTNRHVITNASGTRVASRVGPIVPARVVGYPKDEEVDLALLVVRLRGLEPAGPIADFGDIHVGEPVVAIGHPLGLDYTVTNGIVSAKRDSMELQTSAAINPGNSGGPLINREGRVIGVNTRTIDPSEGQALSFAIRADVVLNAAAWDLEDDAIYLVDRIERR